MLSDSIFVQGKRLRSNARCTRFPPRAFDCFASRRANARKLKIARYRGKQQIFSLPYLRDSLHPTYLLFPFGKTAEPNFSNLYPRDIFKSKSIPLVRISFANFPFPSLRAAATITTIPTDIIAIIIRMEQRYRSRAGRYSVLPMPRAAYARNVSRNNGL